jgi:hypothetical protein
MREIKDEASSKPTFGPSGGFPGANPFDFSAMSGLLNVRYFLHCCIIFILCVVCVH